MIAEGCEIECLLKHKWQIQIVRVDCKGNQKSSSSNTFSRGPYKAKGSHSRQLKKNLVTLKIIVYMFKLICPDQTHCIET